MQTPARPAALPRIRKFMQEILFEYKLNPTTWAYMSSLMMIGIYFKFHRFWSVRNLDLVGLIAFSPGLLLVYGYARPGADAVGLRLAVHRQRVLPGPPAAGPDDGPPAAAGAEPVGRRPDVHRHLRCWCS